MYMFKIILDNGWDVLVPIHADSVQDAWYEVVIEAIKCSNNLNHNLASIHYVNNRASILHTK